MTGGTAGNGRETTPRAAAPASDRIAWTHSVGGRDEPAIGAGEHRGVRLGSLDSAETKPLLRSEEPATYAWPGYLLMRRGRTLLAYPFDATQLALKGEPFVAAESVDARGFSVSQAGVLAFVSINPGTTQPTWFDRAGRPGNGWETGSLRWDRALARWAAGGRPIGTLGMLRDNTSLAGAGNSVIIASSDLVLTSEFQTLVALEADRLSTATALAFLQDVNVTDQIVIVDDLSATATAEANQCQADIGLYQYNLSEPILDPAPGFTFISGTDLFIPTVTWEVTNLGSCEWVSLDIKSAENINDIRYILIRNDVAYAPLPSDPIKVGDSLKVVMIFPLEQAGQIVGDWFLVANGLKLDDKPHLAISQENWVIPVAPSPYPTEPE